MGFQWRSCSCGFEEKLQLAKHLRLNFTVLQLVLKFEPYSSTPCINVFSLLSLSVNVLQCLIFVVVEVLLDVCQLNKEEEKEKQEEEEEARRRLGGSAILLIFVVDTLLPDNKVDGELVAPW